VRSEPDFSRLDKALRCEGEPDYVPLVELGIAKNIKEYWLGRPWATIQDEVEFAVSAGYDYIKLQPVIDMNPGRFGMDHAPMKTKTADGGDRTWASEHGGIIANLEDFEQYVWPKKQDISYSRIEEARALLPDGMKVIGQYGDIFTMAWGLTGFEQFSLALYTDPDLVAALMEKIGSLILSMYETMVTFDHIGALWYSDDIAYTTGLMISPDALREYLFPWIAKIGALAREHDLPFLYHSDGILFEVLEDLYQAGVTALHPIEPLAMEITEVKQRMAGRMCVIGNIDLNYTLTRGTPEETAECVKDRLRNVAPGGGYCLGSSNSVPDYVKPENYRAMVETCRKLGRYPISI